MKYIKTTLSVFIATSIFAATDMNAAPSTNAPVVKSENDAGKWAFAVSGNGATTISGNSKTDFGTDLQIGKFGYFLLPLEVGVRQGIGYSDQTNKNWQFSTRLFADWTLYKVGNLEFDAGANFGPNYGNCTLNWQAAPEAIVRLYLKKDVDLFSQIEYPFNLNAGKSEDVFRYRVGMRIKF